MLKAYLNKIADTTARGDAREESYYEYLSSLIKNIAEEFGKKKIDVTTLPKKTEAGNPDFRIWDGKQHITGYIEAKAPDTKLDIVESSEQLTRYRTTFPNLILTDFYEFRLYRNGELIERAAIGRPFIAKKLKTIPPLEKEKEFIELFEKFFAFSLPKSFTASSLALELAKRTRFLKDEVVSEELKEEKEGKGDIIGFYEAFKKYLIAGLTKKSFADLYSQTITYGLFAARTRADGEFNRALAFNHIPPTIGILRDVFRFISLGNLPKQMEVIIDDISEVLNAADIRKILRQYYKEGKGKDPIIHFYETFLSKYDPEIRERRGVYYTPEPVVGYIVRSVHKLLKTHFALRDGMASKEVTLLDPAGGTLTFPAEAIKQAVQEYTKKYGEGGKSNFIKNQILRNFYAFELMMAPYAIGHLKISFLLEELGYSLQEDDRFKLYLTNTLEMEDVEQISIPGLSSLSEESYLAGKIKKQKSILVILGNPPYSGISLNKNEWTERLLKEDIAGAQSYYKVDGEPLGEKKLWLQDDYVKFLRFAQWKIHKAGKGIVGMITNHSYLDNPTFRGMRQSLMKTFNEIYIIDLHGNSLKKETSPDGGKDENVFDIRQGVAIALFVKQEGKTGCKVYHTGIYGLREKKYNRLEKNNVESSGYQEIKPKSPWYFFIPRHTASIQQYLNWPKINEIFPVNNVGIVTARDRFAIDFDKNILKNRIRQFRDLKIDDEFLKQAFKLKDTSTFKLTRFRKELAKIYNWVDYIEEITYRPLDIRYIYYSKWVVERPIYETMRHMLQGDNLGITIGRQGHVVGKDALWNLAFISDKIIDFNLYYRGGAMSFPLYIYPEENESKKPDIGKTIMMVFEPGVKYGKAKKEPNIAPQIFEKLKKAYGQKPSPEEILYYIYAVFYSNTYREKYAEFLKIDFPRVPFTKDYKLFRKNATFGKRLVELHLLKSNELDPTVAKYQGTSENDTIEKPVYKEKKQRVYINNEKYFEGVEPAVWNYYIGGYQVLQKYLKDRKGRRMDDPRQYVFIATSIKKTIDIQEEIDIIFPNVEKEPIEFSS
jgi:predicted helicase